MASLMVLISIVLLVASAAFQLAGKRRLACRLQVLFPAFLCVADLLDLTGGVRVLGTAGVESDEKQLVYYLVLLALSIIAAIRIQWRWLYWSAWVFNALVCALLVYLAFFWKVFS
jgi:hypothetical protein